MATMTSFERFNTDLFIQALWELSDMPADIGLEPTDLWAYGPMLCRDCHLLMAARYLDGAMPYLFVCSNCGSSSGMFVTKPLWRKLGL